MSGMLLDLLSVTLPMTALILLLWLLARILGHRFTAKCRYILWTTVLLRLCLPFGTLTLPALVQINVIPTTEEALLPEAEPSAETEAPPVILSSPEEELVAICMEQTAPEILGERLDDTIQAIYWYDPELPEGVETEIPDPTPVQPAETTAVSAEPAEPDTTIEIEPEELPSPVQEAVMTPERPADIPPADPESPGAAISSALSPLTLPGIVWLTGAVLYAGWKILSYNLYIARLSGTFTEANGHVHRIYEELCRKYVLRRPPQIRVSAAVHSPMLCGYFHPCVVLPAMEFTANQTVGILAHELTHYRRHDLWIKLACVIGCGLHWFNPAAHLAVSRCHAEMELSCDESVLAGLDEDARRSYGNVMLDILRMCSSKNVTLTTHFNPKKRAVRERFLNIMDMSKKKQGFAVIAAAVLLCSLAGLVFAYETVPPADDEPYIMINDNVSIRIGFGGTSEEEPAVSEDITQTAAEVSPDMEAFRAAFARAEQVYACFTGYTVLPSGGERIVKDGHNYDSVALDTFGYPNTLAGLRAMTAESFSDAITDVLMNTVTGAGVPLYLEENGVLYRFSGYTSLWSYDIGTRDFGFFSSLDGAESSQITVPVTMTYSDDLNDRVTVEYRYTAEERDGIVRFTEFRLPAELLLEQAVYSVEESYLRGGLTIAVPEGMAHYVTIPEQSRTDDDVLLEFYHTAHYEQDPANGYGWLFNIERHTYADLVRDDVNYGGIQYFAAAPDNSYFYFIRRPTDVQWDVTREAPAADYARLAAMKDIIVQRIIEDNGLTPFTGQDIPAIFLLSADTTYPSPDYLARLEYSDAYGWLLRGEGAGADGIAIGDYTKNAEVWAEWISPDCCRLCIKQGPVIDLFRTESGWTTEPSAFTLMEENHMPRWIKAPEFVNASLSDLLRKASFGAMTMDEFLSETAVQAQFIKRTAVFVEPYRTEDTATVHGDPYYVPSGAVFPERITWDSITVSDGTSEDCSYLITLPLGEMTMTIRSEIMASSSGTFSLELTGADFCRTDPILAEEGLLRDVIVSLVEGEATDYYAEIHVPDADNAVLNIHVEGEGRDLHDLKDVFCTSFTAYGQTYRFDTPLDLWGAWGIEVFAAENAVVLFQRPTSYSGNTYVITPKYTYEYHPGAFAVTLYEDNGDLRYRHSSTSICDAAQPSNEQTASILGIATSRDNFYYECGDVMVSGGRLVFCEPDESYTIGEAFDLDTDFANNWKSESFPTIDVLFIYNGERYGNIYDYPSADETALPELLPRPAPTLPLPSSPVPEEFDTDSHYHLQETTGEQTYAYFMGRTTANADGETISSTIFIPQIRIETDTVRAWNRALYERIRDYYAFVPYDYARNHTNDYFVTVTYEEVTVDGVLSLLITFRENLRIDGTTTPYYRMEIHHYDTAADKFLTDAEYLDRLTDGAMDMDDLLISMNAQKFNYVVNGTTETLTEDDLCGILPVSPDDYDRQLDKQNGFDVYLPRNTAREAPVAIHWREYPVFVSEEGIQTSVRLIREASPDSYYQTYVYLYDPNGLSNWYAGELLGCRYDYRDNRIFAEVRYLDRNGETASQTISFPDSPAPDYYFGKYLDGSYSMSDLLAVSSKFYDSVIDHMEELLIAYQSGVKPLPSAPDYPADAEPMERIRTHRFTETGNPALPLKSSLVLTNQRYELWDMDSLWVMEIYWDVSASREIVVKNVAFRRYSEAFAEDAPPLESTEALYAKTTSDGKYTDRYLYTSLKDSSHEGKQVETSIAIPQLTVETDVTAMWNTLIFRKISQAYEALQREYRTAETSDRCVTVTFEEIVRNGVVSIPITFTEQARNEHGSLRVTAAHAEVYHYDMAKDMFLTNEEYLLRLTDGAFDLDTLLVSLNEQEFNRVMNAPHAHLLPGHDVGTFSLNDLYGIVPSELDDNGFDVYLPLNNAYNVSSFKEAVVAVHWRDYPVYTVEEGYWITYRLIRQSDGYCMLTYIEDTRDLPLPEENQGQRTINVGNIYKGNLFKLTYSDEQDYATDSISAKITYLNGKGEPFTKTVSYGTYTAAETYFEKYLAGTYDMKILMDHALMVQICGENLLHNLLTAYRDGEKPLADAPDVPDGLTLPKWLKGVAIADCFAETGDPAQPFKFAVPLDDGWIMDVYWHIAPDCTMTADSIDFHQ